MRLASFLVQKNVLERSYDFYIKELKLENLTVTFQPKPSSFLFHPQCVLDQEKKFIWTVVF